MRFPWQRGVSAASITFAALGAAGVMTAPGSADGAPEHAGPSSVHGHRSDDEVAPPGDVVNYPPAPPAS
ncbi:hypothetical protein ACFV4F_12025 [Kitasatospora sp. NPDC059722]|uniref:hypothetical protein n=1 Tax=unclassified Kitasatospora TaxID=2633591 RepID=UPI00365DADD2